jgi:Uma2 family endonuclease
MEGMGRGKLAITRGTTIAMAIASNPAPVSDSLAEGSLARPVGIKFPAPLSDETLLWLSSHNTTIQIEQSAEGELILSPFTGSRGQRGEGELYFQIIAWNKSTNFGEVRGPNGGVELPKGGQYGPDVTVMTQAAWDAVPDDAIDRAFVPVLPTGVFELLSPANLTAAGYEAKFQDKLDAYERSAVPLVVLLNPKTLTASIRRPGQDEVTSVESVLRFHELPALELDVAAVYAACNKRGFR